MDQQGLTPISRRIISSPSKLRVAERRCDTTWRHIATELGRIHAVTLTGTAGTVVQTTPPSDAASGFLAACQVDPLPRITHLDPA